jgi:hypothetical protein
MSEHGSISRLSEKCSKCNKKDNCNNKRMEACAYIIPNTTNNAIPSARQEINIRVGNEYVNTEDIQKSIAKQIYKGLSMNDCKLI